MTKKVFVSGCYDLLHSGHVEFFRQAAQYGDLYVGIGSDKTIEGYKHHKTIYSEQERLFMVKSIRYVKDAYINQGSGILDFLPTLDIVQPDILVVNSDGGNDDKRRVCEERGMEYVVLERVPQQGLQARSSTDLKKTESQIPTRLDLAGTWIDQPYVSCFASGWAITISLEPTFEIRERCGLSTSTRNMIKKIWPYNLPNMDPEMLAKLVFCFENDPERSDGIVSGAQDSIGICVPGLCRHFYNNRFWPDRIETCYDETVLSWLEQHLVMQRDLQAFAKAYADSFRAQVAMFPAMIQGCVASYIAQYEHQVLAYKMPGAGGGGYLACVVDDATAFVTQHPEAIRLTIRRPGM